MADHPRKLALRRLVGANGRVARRRRPPGTSLADSPARGGMAMRERRIRHLLLVLTVPALVSAMPTRSWALVDPNDPFIDGSVFVSESDKPCEDVALEFNEVLLALLAAETPGGDSSVAP